MLNFYANKLQSLLSWCHLKEFFLINILWFSLPFILYEICCCALFYTTLLTWGWSKKLLQGIVTAPILFAMEEFPQLRAIVDEGFENPANVDLVS